LGDSNADAGLHRLDVTSEQLELLPV